jgi:hypothetical protein
MASVIGEQSELDSEAQGGKAPGLTERLNESRGSSKRGEEGGEEGGVNMEETPVP